MNACQLLFAAFNLSRFWSNRFRGRGLDTGDMLFLGACIGAATFVLLAVALFFARRRQSGPLNHPGKLFRELCKAHRLDAGERRLLKRLARQHKVSQPSILFLQPARFDLSNLPESWKAEREFLVALRRKLFATPQAEERPTASASRSPQPAGAAV